jgi:hypothetical protein
VRTTGKLPGYLASGRYILASAVGTPVSVLPDDMLIPYNGRWDATYPIKLAARIREIAAHPHLLADGAGLRSRAEQFAYTTISKQAADLIADLLRGKRS